MKNPIPIIHNTSLQRFESQIGENPLAYVTYKNEGNRVVFDHTFVPEELRGEGVAAALVEAALREAKAQHWRIEARCSYVARYLQRHPEFADLQE